MKRALRWANRVDTLTRRVGRGTSWFVLVMVLIGAYNAVVRYLGRFLGTGLSSNAYIEAQWYLFSLVFLLGAAYALQSGSHVRVDVLYSRLSQRGQAWIDLLGHLFFLLPFSAFGLLVSWPSVRNSWQVWEVSPDPGGLPRFPIKTAILFCFGMLFLQGLSEVVKALARLRSPSEEEARQDGAPP